MNFLIDSNVILDILTKDASWFNWSSNALKDAANQGELCINPIIYAEISVRFTRIEDLEDALPTTDFKRMHLPWEAAFLAGKSFLQYRRLGGHKTAPLPDFYIGAHAAVEGMTIITRDQNRYRSYFPSLVLICP